MEAHTFFQRLQVTPALGELDLVTLKPVVSVSADGIVTAISRLWDAMKEQRSLIELMEREASRKRTEQDVKIQNLQSDVESRVYQEARKRQQEDDRLRAELQKTKDELAALVAGLKSDLGTLEGSVSNSIDATLTQMKLAIAQSHQRISDVTNRVDDLDAKSSTLREDIDTHGKRLDFELDRIHTVTRNLHAIWEFTPTQVASALAEGRATALMHESPPFGALLGRMSGVDDKLASIRREVGANTAAISDLSTRTALSEADLLPLKALPDRVMVLEDTLRRLIDTEMGKLRETLESYRNEKQVQSYSPVSVPSGADTSALEAALNALGAHVTALQLTVDRTADEMQLKVPSSALAEYARHADLTALEDRLRALFNTRDVKLQPMQPVAPSQPARDTATAGALLALKDDIEGLAKRLTILEKDLKTLRDSCATRDDVRDACQETLKVAERAINHVYDELRRLLKSQHVAAAPKTDATAGRFRCLSCNRDAGPLSEALRERLSQSQFPPSTTLMSREARDSPSRAAGRSAVPGSKDGVAMTSSRRKLQNYYDWLQTKEGEAGSRSTTPPRTYWLGSQSGGGGPGRQSGNHGSDDPEAIGSDGKYYTGVSSRPQSATGARPKSAPMKREDCDPRLSDV